MGKENRHPGRKNSLDEDSEGGETRTEKVVNPAVWLVRTHKRCGGRSD